jgi:replication factor A2
MAEASMRHWSQLVPDNVSPLAQQVFIVLWVSEQTNEGLGVRFLSSTTGGSEQEVVEAVRELLELQLVFSTVDEYTWAVVEAS